MVDPGIERARHSLFAEIHFDPVNRLWREAGGIVTVVREIGPDGRLTGIESTGSAPPAVEEMAEGVSDKYLILLSLLTSLLLIC